MIDKGLFETFVDSYTLAVVNVYSAKELWRQSPEGGFKNTWAKALKEREDYAGLCRERLMCYVLSSGAEMPTIQELRDARETQGVPV